MTARPWGQGHRFDRLSRLLPVLLGLGVWLGPIEGPGRAQTIVPSSAITTVTDTSTTQPASPGTTNYVITGGLLTRGNAVIHSFSKFDLGAGATATFDLTSSPSTTSAIWARVLSGAPSSLNGTISVRSLLANPVELALVNPFGFVLGTGFNTNGVNALTLIAAPQVYAQSSGTTGGSFVDLLSTATDTTQLSSALRLAGAAYASGDDLARSSITYNSDQLAIKQFNLMAAKIHFAPSSVLKADTLMAVAPWFAGGINFGSGVNGLSGIAFGAYALANPSSMAYSFTADPAVSNIGVLADPAHFLLTRESLYTASSADTFAVGSIEFNGVIEPYSAPTLGAFLVARQAYIRLQNNGTGFTSPFGDYATTAESNGVSPASEGSGFAVVIKVDPSIGPYQPPGAGSGSVNSPTKGSGDSIPQGSGDGIAQGSGSGNDVGSPSDNSFNRHNGQSLGQGPSSFAALPASLSNPQGQGGDPRQAGGQPGASPAGSPSSMAGQGGAGMAISGSTVGMGSGAAPQGGANPPQAGTPPSANQGMGPAPQGNPSTMPAPADQFTTAELAITHDTAQALGVADAEALTPAQLQKLLQAATVSMRERGLRAQAGPTDEAQARRRDQNSWVAVMPTPSATDAGGQTGIFSAANYTPAILSIRFTEAKGRTLKAGADAFFDYTLIPPQGPIIGQRLELNTGQLSGLLKQLYASLSRQEPLDVGDRNSPSRQLYDLLIAPVAEQLHRQRISTLLIAADRGLQGVPFAALHDGQQFFGDRFAFSLTPALSLTDLKVQDDAVKRLLTFGASQFNDGLAPLPLVPQELEKISALTASEAMLNRSFTPSSLLMAAADPRYIWIHVATHAEFLPGGPSQSRLFTGTTPLPLSAFADLRKNRQGHPIDLFSLSACRTALGDAQSELGFAGLAIQAGARSAIGTLWYVDDVATSAYFIQVYRYLKQGLPKAEALQATRRDFSQGRVQLVGNRILAADGELLLDKLNVAEQRRVASGLSNPYFWAGIEMVGSPW